MKTLILCTFFLLAVCSIIMGQSSNQTKADILFKQAREKCLAITKNTTKPKSSMSYAINMTPPVSDSTLSSFSKTISTINKRNLISLINFVDSLMMDGEVEELSSSREALNKFLEVNLYDCEYYFKSDKIALIVRGKDRNLIFKFGPSD